jgi:osmoprotectant transport system permease protein
MSSCADSSPPSVSGRPARIDAVPSLIRHLCSLRFRRTRRSRALVLGSLALALTLGPLAAPAADSAGRHARVGSKNFTESVILAELLRLDAERHDLTLEHERALGGSAILWRALLEGNIDVYPEYEGTLTQELLSGLPQPVTARELTRALYARGLAASAPLGFEDRYALGVPEALAARLQLRTISDLRAHPELRYALSNEFMNRSDGWPGLRRTYGLAPRTLRGMEHTLAYRALAAGAADVVDLYTTDPEIEAYHISVLADDRHYFPSYQAVWLYRLDAAARWPALLQTFDDLAGRISEPAMRRMNAAVQLERRDETAVAAAFLAQLRLPPSTTAHGPATALAGGRGSAVAPALGESSATAMTHQLAARTREHLALVAISLALALLVGLPLGIAAAKLPTFGRFVLAVSVVLQTVPTLAMLVFMIPLFGIGATPAIATLFLYSLLPIVRNTLTGLTTIPAPLGESAASLGLPEHVRLLRIELPLAARTIVAGISTAAVINVGTATLGALIGAGGYGEPILTGIRLNDLPLILEGAVPAALLALLVMALFQLLERWLTPRGLRASHEG